MKIKAVTVNRFRGYSEQVLIGFDYLCVLVGRNDIGKSTILEALDIFFNEGKGCIKIDKEDLNKSCFARGEDQIEISVEFSELPPEIVIDSTNKIVQRNAALAPILGRLPVMRRPTRPRRANWHRAPDVPNGRCPTPWPIRPAQ